MLLRFYGSVRVEPRGVGGFKIVPHLFGPPGFGLDIIPFLPESIGDSSPLVRRHGSEGQLSLACASLFDGVNARTGLYHMGRLGVFLQ